MTQQIEDLVGRQRAAQEERALLLRSDGWFDGDAQVKRQVTQLGDDIRRFDVELGHLREALALRQEQERRNPPPPAKPEPTWVELQVAAIQDRVPVSKERATVEKQRDQVLPLIARQQEELDDLQFEQRKVSADIATLQATTAYLELEPASLARREDLRGQLERLAAQEKDRRDAIEHLNKRKATAESRLKELDEERLIAVVREIAREALEARVRAFRLHDAAKDAERDYLVLIRQAETLNVKVHTTRRPTLPIPVDHDRNLNTAAVEDMLQRWVSGQ